MGAGNETHSVFTGDIRSHRGRRLRRPRGRSRVCRRRTIRRRPRRLTRGPAFTSARNGGFGGDQFQYPFTVGSIPALGFGATTGTSALNSSGFFGGAQIGYNWQFAPAWVAGVEADFDGADIEGKATTTANTFSGNVGSTFDWFGTVRARVGYLVTPTALLYATADGPTATLRPRPMPRHSDCRRSLRPATRRTAGPPAAALNMPLTHGYR